MPLKCRCFSGANLGHSRCTGSSGWRWGSHQKAVKMTRACGRGWTLRGVTVTRGSLEGPREQRLREGRGGQTPDSSQPRSLGGSHQKPGGGATVRILGLGASGRGYSGGQSLAAPDGQDWRPRLLTPERWQRLRWQRERRATCGERGPRERTRWGGCVRGLPAHVGIGDSPPSSASRWGLSRGRAPDCGPRAYSCGS